MKAQHQTIGLVTVLAAVAVVFALGSDRAAGQTITEIISAGLVEPYPLAVDDAGSVYVVGAVSDNAFKITPDGVISEIIDATGDGVGNGLDYPLGIAVDTAGNVYVTGGFSDNAFMITPDGVITEIIDAAGDGIGNGLDGPFGMTVDSVGNAYVTGRDSNNAFRIRLVIPSDFDRDGDVDAEDYGQFKACATGPGVPYNLAALPPECELTADGGILPADFDGDNDVDQSDFGIFQRCISGMGIPADPKCMQ